MVCAFGPRSASELGSSYGGEKVGHTFWWDTDWEDAGTATPEVIMVGVTH